MLYCCFQSSKKFSNCVETVFRSLQKSSMPFRYRFLITEKNFDVDETEILKYIKRRCRFTIPIGLALAETATAQGLVQ